MRGTKLVWAAALALPLLSSTASQADGFTAAGITFGMDHNGVIGFRGEYDISSLVERKPVSIAGYYKRASQTYFGVNANSSALGFTANYNLSRELEIKNPKLQPFVGLGIERVSSEAVTQALGTTIKASASSIDLSYSLGAKYVVSRQLDVSGSLDSFGGLTLGANYKF